MNKSLLVLTSTLFALSAQLSLAATDNSIVNGSFENTPTYLGDNSFATYRSIQGWTAGTSHGIEIRNHHLGTAFDGQKFAELDTSANSWMYQKVSGLQKDKQYTLTFEYAPRYLPVSYESNKIAVYWQHQRLMFDGNDFVSGTGGSADNPSWKQYAITLTASGDRDLDQLSFMAIGTSDSFGGNLDKVSLVPSAVPIPASSMLFASALLGFIGLGRKAKKC